MTIANRLTEEALEAQREIEDLRGALVRSQRELVRAKAKTDHLVAATIQSAHDAVLKKPLIVIHKPVKDVGTRGG